MYGAAQRRCRALLYVFNERVPKNIPYANKIFSQPKYLLVARAGSGCAPHTAARRMNRV